MSAWRARQAGFGYLEGALCLGLAGAIVAALWWTYTAGASAGASKERAAWQGREITQQAAYKAELEKMRNQRDQALGRLQTELAAAELEHLKTKETLAREKAKNDRTSADLRAGRLILRDRGATPCNPPSPGEGPPRPATAGGGDGKPAQPGELSADLSGFLWGEAARADEVIEDLEGTLKHAQAAVTAYYRIAQDCQTGN